MTKQLFQETTSVPTATATRGLWRARVLTPGVGSSGTWVEETIRRDGPRVLRKGARCFVTHNRRENGEPDPFSMWATLASDSWYEDGDGLWADIQVLESWIPKVEEVAPHTALSVYLMGESDEFGNITAILEDPQNGVDMVVYPGREGSELVEKLYESARMESQNNPDVKPTSEITDTKGTIHMDPEVKAAFDELNAKVDTALASKQVEAEATASDEAIQAAVQEALNDRAAKVKAALAAVEAAKADLLPSQIASLTETALLGEDVTASIESNKAIATEAKAHFAEANNKIIDPETGRLGEAATTHVLSGFGPTKEAK